MRDLSELQPSIRTSNLKWTRKQDIKKAQDPNEPELELVSVDEETGASRVGRSIFEGRILNWDLTPVEHYAVAQPADLSQVPGAVNHQIRINESTFTIGSLETNAYAGLSFPVIVPAAGRFYFLWNSNFDVVNSNGGSESIRFINEETDSTICLIGIDENTGGIYEQNAGVLITNNHPQSPKILEIDATNNTLYLRYLTTSDTPERVEVFSGSLENTTIRMEVSRGTDVSEDLGFQFTANPEDIPGELPVTGGYVPYPNPTEPRFPLNAKVGDALKVIVAGSFHGVNYEVGEGALVTSVYPQEVLSLKGNEGGVLAPENPEPRSIGVFEDIQGAQLAKTPVKIDLDGALFGASYKFVEHSESTLVLDPSMNGFRIWVYNPGGTQVSIPSGVEFPQGFNVEIVQTGDVPAVLDKSGHAFVSTGTLQTNGAGSAIGIFLLTTEGTPLWWGSGIGSDGLSAYQLAVEEGFEGSLQDWLDSLKGQDGIGIRILGSLPSPSDLPLTDNTNGDAYIIQQVMWVWDGDSWVIASQAGPAGKSAYQVAVDNGFEGSVNQWLASLEGKSAYQIALDIGAIPPTMTEAQWIASLKGDDAYTVAVNEGFEGTRSEWLASLVGPEGPKGDQGEIGPQGEPAAAVKVLGQVASEQDLPAGADPGDGYFIGLNLWVWNGTQWLDCGEIQGPMGEKGDQGDPGPAGSDGKSAYDVAVDEGFAGTVIQWLESLKGDSAYQVAVDNGFEGTPSEWLASLEGQDGLDAYETAQKYGFVGTYEEWIEFIRGPQGFQGLKGEKGDQGEVGPAGDDAYQIAVQLGFEGTRQEWLDSLKGEKGDKGDKGDQGDVGPQGEQGPQGPIGQGLVINGVVDTEAELPVSPTGNPVYIVKDVQHVFVYQNDVWNDAGQLVGSSAYQVAVAEGFTGTVTEWLDSLIGKSAYQIALDNGFEGTEAEWLLSLKGDQGDQGPQGKSAYEVAVDDGFSGTISEWLESLIGPQGEQGVGLVPKGPLASEQDLPTEVTDGWVYTIGTHIWMGVEGAWQDQGDFSGPEGLSAFQVAQQVDPSLSNEAEYLASLKGEQGDIGPPGPRGLSLIPMGTLPTTDDLPVEGGLNEMYYIDGHAWIWVVDQWVDHGDLKGPQGDVGPQGAGVHILGSLTDPSELPPTADNPGDGYIIDGNFYAWTGSNWENTGPIQGPKGDKGDQGERGLQGEQGLKGDKGDTGEKGTVWLNFDRDPGVLDGRPNDYAINTVTLDYFLKTSDTNWALLGKMGGGNVYDAPADDTPYLRMNQGWKAFTNYTLPVGNTVAFLDLASRNVFEVDASEDRTLEFANAPAANTSMTIAVTVMGSTGLITWPAGIDWINDEPPALGETYTIVTLFWNGRFWVGSVYVSK